MTLIQPEFDPEKDEENRRKHGLSLADFTNFDGSAVIVEDVRRDYGEVRYRAVGRISGVGHCLVYTYRGRRPRLISFRRAHEKELKRYGL